ncbi:MAG TPA: endonuclease/exonuclease/phosphatase family protein [Pyrinomonadaceae bacterium]
MRLPADIESPASPAGGDARGVEFGTFASETRAASTQRRVVVATFNIRYAVGSFLITGGLLRRAGLSRPSRRSALVGGNILRAASLLADGERMPPADVVALQEADRRTTRAGARHVARELAASLRMNYAYAGMSVPRDVAPRTKQWYLNFEEPFGPGDAGDTGVALLSRLPLEETTRIDLPWNDCPWRPRLALAASIPTEHGPVGVLNVHIDPHGPVEARLEQHRAVVATADRLFGSGPVVLLGDFNTLTREARDATRRLLESQGFSTPMPSGTATWRAGLLRLHADWIFVRRARVHRWGVARVRGISDHWPVWAGIEAGD